MTLATVGLSIITIVIATIFIMEQLDKNIIKNSPRKY